MKQEVKIVRREEKVMNHRKAVDVEIDYLLLHLYDAYQEKNLAEVEKIETRLEELRKELAEWKE